MALTPVFIDFETYWSVTHSLTKMSGIEYVMHPETEIQSCSIQVGLGGTATTYFGYDNIKEQFDAIDWDNAWAIAHNNSEFDAMVLAWRFGVKPKMWGCTLAMARPIHAKVAGGSLKGLAKYYGLEDKGSLEAVNTKGKKLEDFTPDEIAAMREYNNGDTRICAELFKILIKLVTRAELRIIDMTMRMLVEPAFEVNVGLLERGLKAERNRKKKVLTDLLLTIDPLAVDIAAGDHEDVVKEVQSRLKSSAKFKQMLLDLDVDIPTKESPTTGKTIPALAKNDAGFLELREHENPMVVAAVEARLDTQSSGLETRTERFINVANMCGGKMPIALRYYGADTTGRWSGTMKLNQQNLPRVNPYQPKISDILRKSLRAPAGYKVVVADLSGIELRVNMFLWKVPYAVSLFTADPANADLYKYFAAHTLYNVPEAEVTKVQRQVGKVSHLGLGFGAGGKTFQDVAKLMGGVELTVDESFDVVNSYRNAHPEIQQGWRTCHSSLDYIKAGNKTNIDPCGICHTSAEGIVTPHGIIRYPNLHTEIDEKSGRPEWWYGQGRTRARIYAGKITENIVQHLARNVMADIALDVAKTDLGKLYPLKHTVHDELIYVVRDEHATEMLDIIQDRMRTPPSWWPELATWSEGDIAQTYGDAK
jgi:DNA polymerase I-like protein with 3'-5' exonuclease and polymerase domains